MDDISRFVAHNTIVTVVEHNKDDANHAILEENLQRLRAARNLDGSPFEIITLPMPAPIMFDGQRLPASYANFYIANSVVLVPTSLIQTTASRSTRCTSYFPIAQSSAFPAAILSGASAPSIA